MATNIARIVRNVRAFYDFTGKTVMAVGMGAGRLIEYTNLAQRVIAVDRDEGAISILANEVRERGLGDKFSIVHSDFMMVSSVADVVLFEFCLHEMPSPRFALEHGRQIAREIVVVDHAPESPWSWFAAEEGAIKKCWNAVSTLPITTQRDILTLQRFPGFPELEARFAGLGSLSRTRIARLRHQHPIVIPMPYRLALLQPGTPFLGAQR